MLQRRPFCVLDWHLGLVSTPKSFVALPLGFLRGFRLEAAASVTLAEMLRSARCLRVFSSDGLFRMNLQSRPVITSTAKDYDNQITDVMLTVATAEGDADCDFHFLDAIPLAYGVALGRVVVMRVDKGWSLQGVGLTFVQRFCNVGMYLVPTDCPAQRLDDYYHSVNQVFITDYSCKSPEDDDGAGDIVKEWLSRIFRLGAPVDADGATRELTTWLRAPEQQRSQHANSLTKVTMSVLARSLQLGMASVHPDAETRNNMAGWSESTHNVHKAFRDRTKARTLAVMGEGFITVARSRENKKVSAALNTVMQCAWWACCSHSTSVIPASHVVNMNTLLVRMHHAACSPCSMTSNVHDHHVASPPRCIVIMLHVMLLLFVVELVRRSESTGDFVVCRVAPLAGPTRRAQDPHHAGERHDWHRRGHHRNVCNAAAAAVLRCRHHGRAVRRRGADCCPQAQEARLPN